jgi:DNA segregation ATPase FtsK/SpoIIIE, S-DNA-T family
MLEDRNRKRDLAALLLAALTAFLALALVTYDPADPPSRLVYPTRAETHNVCGRAGAVVANALLEGVGVGAYFLAISTGVLAAVLLRRKPIGDPWLRGVGWLLALMGLATLASMAVPGLSPGPVIGPGGYLGALGRSLLETHLASVGGYLVALSVLCGGLLLSTDYVLVRLSAYLLGVPAKGLGRGLITAHRLVARRRRPERSERPVRQRAKAAGDDDAADGGVLSVRIRGKSAEASEAAPEAEADDEDVVNNAKQTAEPAAVATAVAGSGAASGDAARPATLLKVKPPAKRGELAEVIEKLDAASRVDEPIDYELPSIDMLLEGEEIPFDEHEKEVRRKAKVLEKTFANFGFNVRVVEIETGPVIAQFEVELEAGLRLSKITSLADDIAIALRVPSVRIVAPIPGKNTVGIEVPNAERQIVRLREVIEEANGKAQKMAIPIYLGKDVAGNPMLVDLATLPHLLIAGRTGTGKSVCLNTIIVSMLMSRRPDEVRMLMIDPKMVELSAYKTLPHLMHPVVTDMRKAEAILAWAVEKMEERYALLARAGVRHIAGYNQLGEEELMDRLQPENDEERREIPTHLPYIVMVADEMADLMMTSAKEVETHIIRLAQKSRAVGIHLVLATQKPTVDVITGLIKSNLPARIAFQVASRTDSRVVLDEMGADKLLGNGDMLFLWPGTSMLIRGQGTYVSDDEINRIVDFVGTSEPEFVKELVQLKVAPAADGAAGGSPFKHRDELYETAIDLVIREGRGSVSLLQRTLGIGYGRAARLIDFMAEDGIVGTYNGSQAREVLLSLEDWQAMSGAAAESPPTPTAASARPRRNRILPNAAESDAEGDDDAPFDDADEEESEDYDASEGEDSEDGADEYADDEEEDDEAEYEEDEYKAESA